MCKYFSVCCVLFTLPHTVEYMQRILTWYVSYLVSYCIVCIVHSRQRDQPLRLLLSLHCRPGKQSFIHSVCEKKELSSPCVFRQKSLERRAKNSWVSHQNPIHLVLLHWSIRDKGCKFEEWILLFLKWCWALWHSGWRCFKWTVICVNNVENVEAKIVWKIVLPPDLLICVQ